MLHSEEIQIRLAVTPVIEDCACDLPSSTREGFANLDDYLIWTGDWVGCFVHYERALRLPDPRGLILLRHLICLLILNSIPEVSLTETVYCGLNTQVVLSWIQRMLVVCMDVGSLLTIGNRL